MFTRPQSDVVERRPRRRLSIFIRVKKTLFLRFPPDNRFRCEVDIGKDLGIPQPLYIRPGTSEFFHPSDRSGMLTMEKSQQIELFCTNGFSHPHQLERHLVSISCVRGSKFHLNGRTYNLNEFTCRKYPLHTAQRRPQRCFNDGILVDIGFRVEQRFLTVMTVCHDPSTEQTYYSQYQLTPANVAAQQGFNRPKFVKGEFFPAKDINFLYSRNQQREAISEIVKSEAWASKLVEGKGDVFLSRGKVLSKNKLMEILIMYKLRLHTSNYRPSLRPTIRSPGSERRFHLCQRTAKHFQLHKRCTSSKILSKKKFFVTNFNCAEISLTLEW